VARPTIKPNHRVTQVFDDLEQYLRFCQDFGYRYDEKDLYNWKSYAYQQFNKHLQGKHAKDMWHLDTRR
jgi:hypothetical protein